MHFVFSDRKAKEKKNKTRNITKTRCLEKMLTTSSSMHDFIEVIGWKAQKVSVTWKKKFELGSLKIKYHGHLNLK